MTAQTMFDKIWRRHAVAEEEGEILLYVDRALIHEGSSHAFAKLDEQQRTVARPRQVFAFNDHYVPITGRARLHGAATRHGALGYPDRPGIYRFLHQQPHRRPAGRRCGRKTRARAYPHEPNVDTNQLCPTRFNKVPRGPKHAQILFHDRRFELDGTEKDFILNREPYRRAQIIVADRNWGGGSSRESAVYALYEFGIRCVIASSFGDIHANNCSKNGLLPVVLTDAEDVALRQQLHDRPGATLSVDLAAQTVTDALGQVHSFDIHPVRKKCLLEGLDDLARTRQHAERFEMFEEGYRKDRPWLFGG